MGWGVISYQLLPSIWSALGAVGCHNGVSFKFFFSGCSDMQYVDAGYDNYGSM